MLIGLLDLPAPSEPVGEVLHPAISFSSAAMAPSEPHRLVRGAGLVPNFAAPSLLTVTMFCY